MTDIIHRVVDFSQVNDVLTSAQAAKTTLDAATAQMTTISAQTQAQVDATIAAGLGPKFNVTQASVTIDGVAYAGNVVVPQQAASSAAGSVTIDGVTITGTTVTVGS